jgi:hypothetical protein
MATGAYQSYEEAIGDYLAKFRALRDAPATRSETVTRGAGDVAAEVLIEQADEIAAISGHMVVLAQDYLEAPDPTRREGISGQLLTQAAAELQVATELLQLTEEHTSARPSAPTPRAARGTALRDAINALEESMAIPLSQGLLPSARATRGGAASPATLDEAKGALKHAATTTTGVILQRVRELGGDIAFDLVTGTQWTAVIEGAALLNKDIANLLETVRQGVGALFARAVAAAGRTLLNVYDKIMAVLGKDVENKARKQVQEWMERIKKDQKVELFDALVGHLYQVDALKHELDERLAMTAAQLGALNQASEAVNALSHKFIILAGRMNALESGLRLAKLIKIPQVLVIVAGLQVALLAAVVYTGYDYIGYKELGPTATSRFVARCRIAARNN